MRRSVKNALDHWRAEGLLTGEQAGTLGASLERGLKAQDSARTALIFGIVGAVLTGMGTILFVASNWEGMGPGQRTAVLLGGYALTVVAALFAEKRRFPLLADAIWLLSTLVLGANIFLIAQSYNLALTLWQGTLAWLIGALAMGYARRSAPQVVVAVPLAILTLGWAGGGTGWFFDDQMEFLFADAGLRPVLPLLGVALMALSTLLARREDTSFGRSPCLSWGTFIVAATLILTTAHVELAELLYRADFTGKQIAIIVGAIGLVAAAVAVGRPRSAATRAAMVATLMLPLMMLAPAAGPPWVAREVGGVHVFFGLYVLAVFVLALLAIWMGIRERNPLLVNIGMVSTTMIIIIQYFGWSFDLLDRSLAFILGGFVLMALSVFVERKRRLIMVQIAA